MRILVHVDQQRAIREGVDAPSSTAHIEIDPAALTPTQREVLADFARDGHDATRAITTRRHGHSRRDRISVTQSTPAALIAELDRIAAERAAWVAEIETREAKRQVQIDEACRRALEEVEGQTEKTQIWIDQWGNISHCEDGVISLEVTVPRLPSRWPGKASPQLETRLRAIETARQAAIEEARKGALPQLQTEFEAREAKREAERQAAIDALRTWALEHGSSRLRLLIEEDMSWQTVAEDEYIAAHTPEGFYALSGHYVDSTVNAPSACAILALREARALAEQSDALSAPEIRQIIEYQQAMANEPDDPEVDVDTDGEVLDDRYEAVRLVVSSPLGKSREVYRRV